MYILSTTNVLENHIHEFEKQLMIFIKTTTFTAKRLKVMQLLILQLQITNLHYRITVLQTL